MPLFRREAVESSTNRLHGEVSLAVPMSWQTIGFLLFGALVVVSAFLLLASYSRIEKVQGVIAPDRGVAGIVARRGGVLSEIKVEEGQSVSVGQVLAVIRTDEDVSGGGAQQRVLDALGRQDSDLAVQGSAIAASASAERSLLVARAASLRGEIGDLDRQIAEQETLIDSAKQDIDSVREVANRGFISGRDMRNREETLVSRRQRASALSQERAAKIGALEEAVRGSARIDADTRSRTAQLAASRSELARQMAGSETARSYEITAPVAGTVSALSGRVGVAVDDTRIMTIVPEKAVLRAELAVPSEAIGFVNAGQTVRLAIDAFPYQKFGTVDARIVSVSATTPGIPQDAGKPMTYPVVAEIPNAWVDAYGGRRKLLPGMSLSARIETERQNLLRWLLDPLFAVSKR